MAQLYKRFLSSFILYCSICPLFAAQPDCDAYRRGVEAYDNWHYNDALKEFLEADNLYPRNGYIYTYLGEIMYFASKYQDAFDLIFESLNYYEPEDNRGKADAFIFIAFLAETPMLANAISGLSKEDAPFYYDAAVFTAPEYARTYCERGNYYNIYQEDFERSVPDYEMAIELDPGEVEPYSRLIWGYQAADMPEKVIDWCKKCMVNVTDYPFHYHNLAKELIKQGKTEEARDLLWQAFMKCDDYYFQGIETVALFPNEYQKWFMEQIKIQQEKEPERDCWKQYLEEMLDLLLLS